MNVLLQRSGLLCVLLLVGCSTLEGVKNSVGGLFGGNDTSSGTLTAIDRGNATPSTLLKYGATLRMGTYQDQRKIPNPRQLGQVTVRVNGITSGELLLDQEVAQVTTLSMKKRFDQEGFQILEGTQAGQALFEVSGIVKELTLDVKERDRITIGIETTIKEVATGKVVWSGLVSEKNERFAGVAGNSKEDIIHYLNKELRIVSSKTVEAISASLMASRPELFNLTPGTRPIAGVTVYVAPTAAAPAPLAPAVVVATPNAAAPAYAPHASATMGLLLVNTNPQRAKVYLDGVYYGMSPLRLEMDPGVHAISVKLEGYKMVTEKVSVRKGDNTELELALER